ncbi:MFS transporter [soil metagenome]
MPDQGVSLDFLDRRLAVALVPYRPTLEFTLQTIVAKQSERAEQSVHSVHSAPVSAHLPVAVRWILLSLSLSTLLSSLGTSIANVGLPTLAEAFHATFQQVQWVVLAYLLAITTLIVSVGRLGDIAGRRRLLLGGILLFTLGSLLCGFAPALWFLIGGRAVQGAGAAIMMALALALIGETVPKDKTGTAMGLLGTMSAIGTALGPSLGGVLIAGCGWQAIFFINLPLGMLAFFLVRRFLPVDLPLADKATPGFEHSGFDYLGSLMLAITLGAYAMAMTVGRSAAGSFHFDVVNAGLLVLAAAGLGLFVLIEKRAAAPMVPLTMFRKPRFSASLAMNALVSTVMMATLVVGPFFLSRAFGLGTAALGVIMSIGPIISAISGFPAGRMVDRLGAPVMVIAGLGAIAAGAFGLALPASLLSPIYGVTAYIAAMAILTPGYQLFQAANNTTVMAEVDARQRGVVSGMLSLSRNLGLVSGASVMGAVFSLGAATSDVLTAPPEAVAAGMRLTFVVAGMLILLAVAIAATSYRKR